MALAPYPCKRALLAAFVYMATVFAAYAASSSRLAIVSDGDDKDLAALVTTELSGNPDISLVERDDLTKIGDELKLQQLAASDSVALGKLIGADGLLFIGKGPNGPQVRFTGVDLGYALFDDQMGSETDQPSLAKSIAHRVAGYAPKLGLDPSKAVPISVLNLRADTASKDSDKIERSLTLLLESRLASLPTYVVLERRHAWSLNFERSLNAAPKSVMQGAFLVDSTFSLTANNDPGITVRLRIRSSTAQESDASITGTTSDLPGLAEKIAMEIQKRTGKGNPFVMWQPRNEAGEYLNEGIWAWKHGTSEEALEALDSAELLGETSPDLLATRINVLCERAGQGMGDPHSGQKPLPSSFESRADDLSRAFLEIGRYRREESSPRSPSPNSTPPRRAGVPEGEVLLVTSRLLFYMDENGYPHADDLRLALRQVSDFDPLHGHLGAAAQLQDPSDSDQLYADEWPQTLDEQLAFYHLICAPLGWFPGNLLYHGDEGFCRRFLKTPEEQKKAFAQFVESLKNMPDGRLAYLLFKSRSPDPAEADQAFSDYVAELWKDRDNVIENPHYMPLWIYPSTVGPDVLTRNAGKMVPLLRYYLTHWKTSTTESAVLRLLWQPNGWSESDALAVWPDYQLFKAHLTENWKEKGNTMSAMPFYLSQYEDPVRKKFPQVLLAVETDSSHSPPLVIKRFWYFGLSPGAPKEMAAHYSTWDLTRDDLWMKCSFEGQKDFICRVHLPSLQAEIIEPPTGVIFQQARVSSTALYMDYSLATDGTHGIARYDFVTKTWALHPLSLSVSKFYLIGDDIYLDLWSLQANPYKEETGVARYDWDSGRITLLASSRRKPAQNQFDDRSEPVQVTFSRALDIFAGPGGRPCMTTSEGTFYIQEQPGNWLPVFDASCGGQPLTLNDGTLIATHNGEAVLLSPGRQDPEYLMAIQAPFFRKIQPKPVKEITPWAGKTFWDAPADAEFGADGYCNDNIGVHHDLFFVLLASSTKIKGDYELLVYSKNSGRAPRHIPLQFQLAPATRELLNPLYKGEGEGMTIDDIDHPGGPLFRPDLIAANQGLCFHLFGGGIWFLPYEDIETYLAGHGQKPVAAQVTTRSDPLGTSPRSSPDELDPSNPVTQLYAKP